MNIFFDELFCLFLMYFLILHFFPVVISTEGNKENIGGKHFMTMEAFYCYHEQLFDSFSKRVIKHIGIDLFKKQQGLGNIEIALSALPKRDRDSLSVEDTYKLDTGSATYDVLGTPITVANPLGQALRFLPPQRREVLLLCYFAEMSDSQIGKILNLTAAAVNYRRKKALDALRTILEAMDLDEA